VRGNSLVPFARNLPGAFSLVEVAIAIGVAAIVLVGIFGLVAVGLRLGRESGQEIAAANLVTSLMADYRRDPLRVTGSGYPLMALTNTGTNAATNAIPRFWVSESGAVTTNAAAAQFAVEGEVVVPTGTAGATVSFDLVWPPEVPNPSGRWRVVGVVARP
jgi:type II secretory pathway pseudopilin PulG